MMALFIAVKDRFSVVYRVGSDIGYISFGTNGYPNGLYSIEK